MTCGESNLINPLIPLNYRVLCSSVVINKKEQLQGTLSSTIVYVIDGIVDMASVSIKVPENGLHISGLGFGVSKLFTSAASATLFVVDPAGTYSGNLFVDGIVMDVSGVGSKVLDLDNAQNFGAIEFINSNFENCTSLGEISNYRQGRTSNLAFINVADGFTCSGTWAGGWAVTGTIALQSPGNVTLFKEGTALTFAGSITSDMNALGMLSTDTLFDFVEANIVNDGAFRLNGVRVNLLMNAVPNISHTSVKVKFAQCSGIDNTYVGTAFTISSSVATTVALQNTLYKLAGTTAYTEQHWYSNSVSNAPIYDSLLQTEQKAEFSLSLSGPNNNVVGLQIRQWDNSASSYVDIGPRFTATLNAGGRAENVTGAWFVTMNQLDRLEIWVENKTSAGDITADTAGSVLIQERAS